MGHKNDSKTNVDMTIPAEHRCSYLLWISLEPNVDYPLNGHPVVIFYSHI